MNQFIKTPVRIERQGEFFLLERPFSSPMEKLDNLIELIVFTPRGSFSGDPDFGFEYWNYEFTNIQFREFNNGQKMSYSDVTRQICEDSIRQSILTYGSDLKNVVVTMELRALSELEQRKRRTFSRYEVVVNVSGAMDDGLGTTREYYKNVRFLMEPTAKTHMI